MTTADKLDAALECLHSEMDPWCANHGFKLVESLTDADSIEVKYQKGDLYLSVSGDMRSSIGAIFHTPIVVDGIEKSDGAFDRDRSISLETIVRYRAPHEKDFYKELVKFIWIDRIGQVRDRIRLYQEVMDRYAQDLLQGNLSAFDELSLAALTIRGLIDPKKDHGTPLGCSILFWIAFLGTCLLLHQALFWIYRQL